MGSNKLTIKIKLGYGACGFGLDLIFIVMAIILMNYLTDTIGLTAGLAGIALMVGRAWDAFYDPVIGYISDRTVTNMGRRRPFMLAGAIPLSISMIFMFTNPSFFFGSSISQTTLFIYVVIVHIIMCTAFSTVFIPFASLAPELTTDYHERTSLNSYRMGFSAVSTLLGAGLALPIVGLCSDRNLGFLLMGSIFGIVMFISVMTTVFTVKEPVHVNSDNSMNFLQSIGRIFRNRPYVLILIGYILNSMAITLVSSISIYYFKYILGSESMTTPAMVIMLVSALVFIPVSVLISKKMGKKTCYGLALIIMAVSLLVLYFLGHVMGVNFNLGMMVFVGIGVGLAYVMPYAIVADTIEYDYLMTGKRREGVFFGFMSWGLKMGQALAVFLMGLTLEGMGYVANVLNQTESARIGIRLFLGPATAMLLVLAAAVLYFYPINQKRYEEILAQIADRDTKVGKKD